MRSTHACTPSFAHLFSIFTSVVVYSRTKTTNQTYQNTYLRSRVCRYCLVSCSVLFCITSFIKSAAKKKMRSTHACTPTLAHLSSQYSRRLLSILAHHNKQKLKNKRSEAPAAINPHHCVSILTKDFFFS